ncbi:MULTISPECIES: MDR family MFS transporter [Novosphingobium]|uniref:MDR family MFS transporter n=1 Tax=Novosphingobium TaxID=165696 RepID=UPI0022F24936|nr:MDR family MFS transporter [Novosphingobium resinovorum]GLK44209.1 hypothetical protein GCM10017612_21290 [Novosphingobium resinovorum]
MNAYRRLARAATGEAPDIQDDEKPQTTRARFWLALSGLLLTAALAALDNFIVNPALPHIVSEFGALSRLSWVMTAFMLASTVTMPLYGKFSDIHGRRPLFTLAILVFLGGSALCGAAQSMTQLIVFRAIQGMGAGGASVLALTTLGDLVTPRERPRYQGLFNATYTLSSIAGPVVGGAVTEWLGWRWVFYINLPVGAAALAMVWLTLPPNLAPRKGHAIDFAGVTLLVCGTVAFLLFLGMLDGSAASTPLAMAGTGVLCVLAFAALYRQEKRAAEPVLAVHLLENTVFRRTVVASTMIGLAFFGSSVFLPLFFQTVGGHSTASSGLMILPHLIAGTTMSLLGGQVVSRTGRYKAPIVGGMVLLAIGFFGIATVTAMGLGDSAWICCLLLMGSGGGLCMPNLTVAVQNCVPRAELGTGTSTLQFCNQLAAVAAVAGSGLLLTHHLRDYARTALPAPLAERVLREGVALIEALPPALHDAVVAIYAHAFIVTFVTSGMLTCLAVGVALRIPEIRLGDGD